MSAHTPGPWMIVAESGCWFPVLSTKDKIPATKANAQLVSAAPDLLAAMKAEVAYRNDVDAHEDKCPYCAGMDGRGCPWDGWERRKEVEAMKAAAIAKAERRGA